MRIILVMCSFSKNRGVILALF